MKNKFDIYNFINKFKFVEFFARNHFDAYAAVLFGIFVFIYFWNCSFENFLGIILSVGGFVFWLKSLKDLGVSFQAIPDAKQIVSKGMYSKFRHPIYYFGWIFFFGLAIYSSNKIILFLVIVLAAVQVFRIYLEEKLLEKKFGKKYLDYKKKTWF